MNKSIAVLAAAGALALGVQQAQATATLRLKNGATTITVADGSGLDGSGVANVVLFNGTVGNYQINVTTGIFGGTTSQPTFDLNSVDKSSGAGDPGVLSLQFSADGLGPISGSAFPAIGGTIAAGGSVTYNVWSGTSLFDHTTLVATKSFTTPPTAFSADLLGTIVVPAGSSVTLEVLLHNPSGSNKSTSFDASLSVPDGGATAMLLGMGFLGLGALARRKA